MIGVVSVFVLHRGVSSSVQQQDHDVLMSLMRGHVQRRYVLNLYVHLPTATVVAVTTTTTTTTTSTITTTVLLPHVACARFFLEAGCTSVPSCHPTNSVRALEELSVQRKLSP